jgi:Domain of unknown function (DUF1707)
MPSDPKIRASDQDRDRTAALLREHHAAGRLTLDEFNERLDKVYAAKTVGELDALMADLPAIDLYQLPDASLRRGPGGDPRLPWWRPPGALMATHGGFSPAWQAAWGGWLSIGSICFVIWLLSGTSLTNPWFLWVVGPWGLFMLGRWITGAPGHGPGGHGPGGAGAPGSDRHRGRDRDGGRPGDRGRDRGRPGDPGRGWDRDRRRGRDRHRGRGYRGDADRG